MKMETIVLPPLQIVGFRLCCDSFEEFQVEIPNTRNMLLEYRDTIRNILKPDIQIGVFKGSPENEFETAYFIGYQVSHFENIPKNMVSIQVPTQEYAYTHFCGDEKDSQNAYISLEEFIRENGYVKLDRNWGLELHPTPDDWEKKEFEFRIHIPIRK